MPNKLVCYFAHDSTLASFYYAFELDKKYSEQLMNATFCSYFAIECTINTSDEDEKQEGFTTQLESIVEVDDVEKNQSSSDKDNFISPSRKNLRLHKTIKFVEFDPEIPELEMHSESNEF